MGTNNRKRGFISDKPSECSSILASSTDAIVSGTLDGTIRGWNKGAEQIYGYAAAEVIGKLVAERAVKAGIKEVVFDRGGYLYHGRVKALADAARTAGLSF